MNVLAFDTCMAACSVALIVSGSERLCHRFALMERGHSETLFPMLGSIMQEGRLKFADLDRIAVTRGPGTFTGVRAGIAAARGLALACDAPVVTATSLEVMALACRERLGGECASGFVVAHDARRGAFYVQSFDAEAGALSAPALATSNEAARIAAPFGLVAGTGARAVAAEAECSGASLRFALPDLLPDAVHLARLALGRAPSDMPAAPLYLRAPDAKPQMDKHLARV